MGIWTKVSSMCGMKWSGIFLQSHVKFFIGLVPISPCCNFHFALWKFSHWTFLITMPINFLLYENLQSAKWKVKISTWWKRGPGSENIFSFCLARPYSGTYPIACFCRQYWKHTLKIEQCYPQNRSNLTLVICTLKNSKMYPHGLMPPKSEKVPSKSIKMVPSKS